VNTSTSPDPLPAPILYTVPEASEALRICPTNLYGLIRSGRLESVKVGAKRLIPADAIATFVEGLREPSAAASSARPKIGATDGNA
jgi:excisionase family DNA binding protein